MHDKWIKFSNKHVCLKNTQNSQSTRIGTIIYTLLFNSWLYTFVPYSMDPWVSVYVELYIGYAGYHAEVVT